MRFSLFSRTRKLISDLEHLVAEKRAESEASADSFRQTLAQASESIDRLIDQTLPAPIPQITVLDEHRAMLALIRADERKDHQR